MHLLKILFRLCLPALVATSVMSGCGTSHDVTYFAGGGGDNAKGSGTVTYVDASGDTKTESVVFPWSKTISVGGGTQLRLTVTPAEASVTFGQMTIPVSVRCRITIGDEAKDSSGLREGKAECNTTVQA